MKANKIELNGEVILDISTDTATPETVAEGVTFHMADGTPAIGTATPGSGGGGAELNIAYGDTPPEDTSKLWVKTSEPSGVVVSSEMQYKENTNVSYTLLDSKVLNVCSKHLTPKLDGSKILYDTRKYNATLYGYLESFNIDTGEVKVEASYTLPKNAPVSFFGNDCMYLLGNDGSTIYKYDIVTGTLTTLNISLVSEPNESRSAIAVGNKAYLFGSNIHVFDMESESVELLDVIMPTTKSQETTLVCDDGIIYIIGGSTRGNGGTGDSSIYTFDIETGILEQKNATCEAVVDSAACAIENKIYIFGGGTTLISEVTNTIKLYDPESDKITTLPTRLKKASSDQHCIAIGSNVYLLGGYVVKSTVSYDIYRYGTGIVVSLDNGVVQIKGGTTEKNLFSFINTDTVTAKIGVERVYKGNKDGEGERVEAALYKDGAWTTV